jgi:hypothetical protein
MKKLLYILWLLMGISACQSGSAEMEVKKYYDLKGLVERQIKALKLEKPKIKKSISMNETLENQTIDSLDWSQELDFFIQAE